MYPIEREDYINAYIAAISDEMRQSRRSQQLAEGRPLGAVDRLYRTVSRILNRDPAGPPQTTNPLPVG